MEIECNVNDLVNKTVLQLWSTQYFTSCDNPYDEIVPEFFRTANNDNLKTSLQSNGFVMTWDFMSSI
jgi:hypothetical protein